MNKFETLLFEIAPWTQEIMETSKTLNNGSFLRGRTGWIRRKIDNPESIYEHSCKVGIAAWYLFKTNDAVAQAIIHDFPEIFKPDYLPGEIDPAEKRKIEYAVMRRLKKTLPNGSYWFEVWEHFENQRGIGKEINELDKMCPCIQAIDYLPYYPKHNLEEFYPHARKKITTPPLLNLLDEMCLNHIVINGSAYDTYFKKLEQINYSKRPFSLISTSST
jgi:5'-deoxynucleotidase YfbR-like HD superfamily hydrolase